MHVHYGIQEYISRVIINPHQILQDAWFKIPSYFSRFCPYLLKSQLLPICINLLAYHVTLVHAWQIIRRQIEWVSCHVSLAYASHRVVVYDVCICSGMEKKNIKKRRRNPKAKLIYVLAVNIITTSLISNGHSKFLSVVNVWQ